MFTNHPSSFSYETLFTDLRNLATSKNWNYHTSKYISIRRGCHKDALHCSFVLCVLYLHFVNGAPALALTVPAVLCSFPLLQRAGGGGLVFNFQFSTFQILSTRKVGSFSVNLFQQTEYSFQMKCQQCLKTFILMP